MIRRAILPVLLLLPGCGIISYSENTVSAEALHARSDRPGIRTEVRFIPDRAVDRVHNALLYAWSPIVLLEDGKEFHLEVTLRAKLPLADSSVRLESVRLLNSEGEFHTIAMSNSNQWTPLTGEAIGYRSNEMFSMPAGECFLEIDFLIRESLSSPTQVKRRWRLHRTKVREAGAGWKSA